MLKKNHDSQAQSASSSRRGAGRSLALGGVLVVTVVYLVVAASLFYLKGDGSLTLPFRDNPPVIEFTWTPLGEVDLKTVVGHLKMSDDKALDFGTYRMTVMETGNTYDLPIQGGVIGRLYETDLRFSWLANNPNLLSSDRMTLNFSIADNAGHKTSLIKAIPLKNWRAVYPKP